MLGFDRPHSGLESAIVVRSVFEFPAYISRNCFESSTDKTENCDSMEIGKEYGRKWEKSGIETTYNIWRLKIHWTLEAFNNAIIG